ncbi:MAG: type II secretion system F family protein [Lachnospiraceae bacterium]|nr:type II secretion system F family protein [Lachnospiraceae bacterium]
MAKKEKEPKKRKKEKEPQYYLSATNQQTYNYKVYYMSSVEKMVYFLIAFAVGAAVGYLFYGGLAKDSYGEATTTTWILNIVISVGCGAIAGRLFLPMRTEQIRKKRQMELNRQFRDMLEALNTSLGAGKNVTDSFRSAYEDMKIQYDVGAPILNELEVVLAGIENNINIEDVLSDFGERSGNDDIVSFADVFRVCYRKGGNMKDTIRSTHEVLSDKMEIREEIETIVTSNRSEQYMMIAMPILLIAIIKMMSPDFAANFTTVTGVLSTTIAVIIFVIAYKIGQAVLDIKI